MTPAQRTTRRTKLRVQLDEVEDAIIEYSNAPPFRLIEKAEKIQRELEALRQDLKPIPKPTKRDGGNRALRLEQIRMRMQARGLIEISTAFGVDMTLQLLLTVRYAAAVRDVPLSSGESCFHIYTTRHGRDAIVAIQHAWQLASAHKTLPPSIGAIARFFRKKDYLLTEFKAARALDATDATLWAMLKKELTALI